MRQVAPADLNSDLGKQRCNLDIANRCAKSRTKAEHNAAELNSKHPKVSHNYMKRQVSLVRLQIGISVPGPCCSAAGLCDGLEAHGARPVRAACGALDGGGEAGCERSGAAAAARWPLRWSVLAKAAPSEAARSWRGKRRGACVPAGAGGTGRRATGIRLPRGRRLSVHSFHLHH